MVNSQRCGRHKRQNEIRQPAYTKVDGGFHPVNQHTHRLAGYGEQGDRQQLQVRPPAAAYTGHQGDDSHHQAKVVQAIDPREAAEFHRSQKG